MAGGGACEFRGQEHMSSRLSCRLVYGDRFAVPGAGWRRERPALAEGRPETAKQLFRCPTFPIGRLPEQPPGATLSIGMRSHVFSYHQKSLWGIFVACACQEHRFFRL